MKIATWNLQSDHLLSDRRRQAFLATMDAVNADVWVLTETWLLFSPGKDYHHVTHSCEAPDLGADQNRRYVSIWSRLPASVVEVRSDPRRMACVRVGRPGWPNVVVVGSVLPWRADGGSREFRRALRVQSDEWPRLWGDPESSALCVAGDLNQELEGGLGAGTMDGRADLEEALGASE